MFALEKDDPRMDVIKTEIARRHGVIVGNDDPILIVHTLNALLAEENAQAHQKSLKAFQEMLEASAKRWLADASKQAEAITQAAIEQAETIQQAAIEDGHKLKADAQGQAKALIAACLAASEEQMQHFVANGTERAKNDILSQIALIKTQLESPIRAAKGLAVMSLFSGVLVVLSAITVLWTVM